MDAPLKRIAVGGIVLCGGQSSRMGQPKAWLPFGRQTMLQRVVETVSRVTGPIVVVAAPGQEVPDLPPGVRIVRDEVEGQGPLAGIAAGLSALFGQAEAAYASSCDVPLLLPSFVSTVIDALGDSEIAIPREKQYYHPLAAVYRTSLAARCNELISVGKRRPVHLVEESHSRIIEVDDLRRVDPQLRSLKNANTPQEYVQLLRAAGYDPPEGLD